MNNCEHQPIEMDDFFGMKCPICEVTRLRADNAELVRALKQIGEEPIAVCGQGSIGLPDIIERMGEIARAALAKVGK